MDNSLLIYRTFRFFVCSNFIVESCEVNVLAEWENYWRYYFQVHQWFNFQFEMNNRLILITHSNIIQWLYISKIRIFVVILLVFIFLCFVSDFCALIYACKTDNNWNVSKSIQSSRFILCYISIYIYMKQFEKITKSVKGFCIIVFVIQVISMLNTYKMNLFWKKL